MLKAKINEVEPSGELEFPFIGELKYNKASRLIVLFLDKNTSIILYNNVPHSDFSSYKVGEMNKYLDVSLFNKFDGEVVLSNGNFGV